MPTHLQNEATNRPNVSANWCMQTLVKLINTLAITTCGLVPLISTVLWLYTWPSHCWNPLFKMAPIPKQSVPLFNKDEVNHGVNSIHLLLTMVTCPNLNQAWKRVFLIVTVNTIIRASSWILGQCFVKPNLHLLSLCAQLDMKRSTQNANPLKNHRALAHKNGWASWRINWFWVAFTWSQTRSIDLLKFQ